MSAAQVFGIANPFALIGWAILVAAIVFGRPWLRDAIARTLWPLALSTLYIAALAIGWGEASGGFSSLADVRALFASEWMLLAGWVHYLAFDLFVGAWIAAETERTGTSRIVLVPVLPLTFLFGPAGYFLFLVLRHAFARGRALHWGG